MKSDWATLELSCWENVCLVWSGSGPGPDWWKYFKSETENISARKVL